MSEKSFLKHKIFLLAIFLLGNTVIVFPKGIGIETAVYSLLLSIIPTVFICCILIKANRKPIILNKTTECLVAIFGIIVFVICARDYISFVDTVRLPKTPRIIIATVFVLISFFLGMMKNKVLYLFSFFSLIITALIIITVFAFSMNNLNFSALTIEKFDIKIFIRQSLTYYIHSFGQLVIPVFLFRDKSVFQDKKIYISGIVLGFVLMLVYVINIMLVLGSYTAGAVEYPYATLTSLVSFGRNFSRLDGFTYYIYFYSSLIKCAVSVNVILSFVKKHKKTVAVLLATVFLMLCNLNFLQNFLSTDAANLIILLFEILLPVSLNYFHRVKPHRK